MTKAKILIVEDEAIIAMQIESSLKNLGYQVTSVVNSGADAIQKVEEDKPDLILMDIRIKGELDGIETAEIIKNTYGIPVVFSTAYLDEERIERAKITMPFGYVLKPIQERDLKVTLEMALYVSKADTERRRLEEALKEYEKVIEGSKDIIVVVDDNYIYKLANGAFLKYNQVEKSQVLGKSAIDLMGKETFKNTIKPYVDRALNGEVVQYEMTRQYKDLGERQLHVSYFPIKTKSGNERRVAAIIRDTSESSKYKTALIESEKRLKQAHKLANIGHWDWFMESGELVWSDEVYEIFGQDQESYQVTAKSFEQTIHPEDYEAFVIEREKALAEQRDVNIEHRIILPDGSIRHVHEIAEIIRDEAGKVVRVMGVVQEITDRKQSEKKQKKT